MFEANARGNIQTHTLHVFTMIPDLCVVHLKWRSWDGRGCLDKCFSSPLDLPSLYSPPNGQCIHSEHHTYYSTLGHIFCGSLYIPKEFYVPVTSDWLWGGATCLFKTESLNTDLDSRHFSSRSLSPGSSSSSSLPQTDWCDPLLWRIYLYLVFPTDFWIIASLL